MKILLDTNVILDLLLSREPFSNEAVKIFSLVESKKFEAYLCATTITTVYYLISKSLKKSQSDKVIEDLLQLFKIASVDKDVLLSSLKNNGKGFTNSTVLVQEPRGFLASIKQS